MTDDDLDLELDETPARPRKPAPKPQPAPTSPSPVASAPRPATAQPASPAAQAPKAVGARKPGLFQRVTDRVSTHRPTWNWKTFLLLFVVLVILVVFAENWSPTRFYFFGLRWEMPKAVAFLISAVIGAFLMWFWLRRPGRDAESGQ